ncbi:antA/AntB antirepressor family protein [Serratia oryzae]|uniref:AntA/AntB antirepressor family protein n=1 Tax=Serratia oryzae TaxID=2034155 RepID=A0A1S8CHX9_9GAMM|nr:antA/AntB antirepressor family protein [Serratia oryzae]OMQ22187.1 antA/AntB antirepressor family protein [Serratia oryzae]
MKIEKTANIGRGQAHLKESHGDINSNEFSILVPVIAGRIGGRESNIVSAKALHKTLGVGRDFTNWIKGRISQYGFIATTDYVLVENLSAPKRASTKARQQLEHDYLITLGMAKELAMVERTPQGQAIRQYFIRCEEKLQRIAPKVTAELRQRLKARITAASYFKPMCAALELARAEQGKKTLAHHFTTESNMISRLVLGGMTAKQWAQASSVAGEPRDSMNADQLAHFSYLEQTNITLIELGQGYHQRKAKLTELSQRWLAKRLGADHV